jgi:hypothetical protein
MGDPDQRSSAAGDVIYLPSASCPECGERSVFAELGRDETPVLLCMDCRLEWTSRSETGRNLSLVADVVVDFATNDE